MSDTTVDQFLAFLQVDRSAPSLSFLNTLIRQHQLKVKWENLSKILDGEKARQTGAYLPSLDEYVQRLVQHGFGGTCFTISIGFYHLLHSLSFQVDYLYMDPGHVCLRVDLDQPYYVDLGFCAPLYQAMPLYHSFEAQNNRETFNYTVSANNKITIFRGIGEEKVLDPTPIGLDQIWPLIERSYDWETSPSLKETTMFGYVDHKPTSLTHRTLKQHLGGGQKSVKVLSDAEIQYWVQRRFKMDDELYMRALDIHQRHVKLALVSQRSID